MGEWSKEAEVTHRPSRKRDQRRWRGRVGWGASGGVAAGVALLVLLSPFSAASFPKQTFVPPYSAYPGSFVQASTLTVSTGCGTVTTISTSPGFSLKTGKATEAGWVSAKACGPAPPGSSNGADEFLAAGFFGPNFTVAAKGLHHLTVHWVVKWTFNLSAKHGPSPQTASASAEFFVVGSVDDLTNGSSFSSSNLPIVFKIIGSGTLNAHGNLTATVFINGTLVPAHTYVFNTLVTLLLSVSVSASGTSSATAKGDLATGGNGAVLKSLVVV